MATGEHDIITVKKKTRQKPMYVLRHGAEVKLLCMRLHMTISDYIMYMRGMWKFSWNFLKFFQKLPSAYIFVNCTNLSKLDVKIIFDTYVNFIKCDIPQENASKRQILLFAYISQMPWPFWVILVPKWNVVDGESKNIVLGSISAFWLFIFVFPKITVKCSVNTSWKLILKISWRIMADDEYNQFCLKSLPQR